MRLFALCAAAGVALSALAVTNSASAAPYHLIKWSGIDACQIWDNGIGKPMPGNYVPVSKPVPTFEAALAVKAGLMKKGVCKI